MSKERARRRAERAAAIEQAAAERAARQAREARRRARWRWLAVLVPRPGRQPGGVLARRRRVQNRVVLGLFVVVQVVGWVLLPTWTARFALLLLSVLLVPVVVTLAFDRRR
ncbi:hypothetical protein DPM19_06450 [Actinomadura craniellae]|uniref:Uncharacterized protein n=1 Tax=Actinomadura craniellae TaxID=2231787 RepID=A0A365HBI8_9ACTN|nr:hypothetical protein [Actinomadura craniellae]RAY16500.1 hypothetical protein DPM19_06450 [Actinomadura craniellae]